MMLPPVKLTGKPGQIQEFLDRFDLFLFDCDGVLWQGAQLLPKTVETLDMLRAKGKQIIFVTNNSTKSRASYIGRFAELGIPAKLDEIFCSAYSAAVYIARVLKIEKGKRVYVIGEEGIEQELEAEGVEWFGGTDPAESGPMTAEDYDSFEPDPTVAVVLCGLDRNIGYRKIARAWQFLQNPDTVFLATNSDPTYPTNGRLFPGAGACAAALVCMSGKTPLSLGKPSTAMMDAIEGRFKFDRKRACMVGDRLDTDVSFGVYGGLGGTLAVLTGVVKEHELLGANTEVVPSAYLDSLMDLLAAEEVDSS